MLLPIRTKNVPEQLPSITFILLGANILIYAFTTELGLVIKDSALEAGGISYIQREAHRWVSSMFLHADIFHLIGNMLFLWIFGCAVEGRLGWWKYLILYALAGVGGTVAHMTVFGSLHPEMPMIGASGAIMGLIGAALFMFPFAPITFFYIFYFRFGTVDWPLWGAAAYYLGLDLLEVLIFGGKSGGTANLAHLGGALVGVVVAIIYRPKRDSAYVSEAKATFHETRDYRMFTRTQLQEMYDLQSSNKELLIHLISRAQRDAFRLDPKYLAEFNRALPALARDSAHEALLPVLLQLSSTPGTVSAVALQQYAARLEKEGQPQPAYQFLDRVVKDPTATPADWENALYRMGMIRESWFQDWQGAKEAYEMFLHNYPMSPMAQQVRTRLQVVSAKA